MKSLINYIFWCTLTTALCSAHASNKTDILNKFTQLVNNPAEARSFRREIINSPDKARELQQELGSVIAKEINSISSSLPMKIDHVTVMDAASFSGLNITYKYSLLEGSGINQKNFTSLKELTAPQFCSSPAAAWLLLGYEWSFFYYYENAKYVGGFVIDAKTCNFE